MQVVLNSDDIAADKPDWHAMSNRTSTQTLLVCARWQHRANNIIYTQCKGQQQEMVNLPVWITHGIQVQAIYYMLSGNRQRTFAKVKAVGL